MKDLKEIRNELDRIDDQLIRLFSQRMSLARDVAAYKKEHGLPILDTGREREIINRVSLEAGEDMAHYAKLLYQTLFSVSKAYQARQLYSPSHLNGEIEPGHGGGLFPESHGKDVRVCGYPVHGQLRRGVQRRGKRHVPLWRAAH